MGDVMGDLSSKRGRIGGMFQRGDARVVAASVPLAEMFGYVNRLRSITSGAACSACQFSPLRGAPGESGVRSSWPRSGASPRRGGRRPCGRGWFGGSRRMSKQKFERTKPHVNVGRLGTWITGRRR